MSKCSHSSVYRRTAIPLVLPNTLVQNGSIIASAVPEECTHVPCAHASRHSEPLYPKLQRSEIILL